MMHKLLCVLLTSLAIAKAIPQQVTFNLHTSLVPSSPIDDDWLDDTTSNRFEKGAAESLLTPSPTLLARPTTVYRPRSFEVLQNARLRSLQHQESAAEQVEWDPVQVLGPDVESRHTLAQLARMAGNAYALPGQSNWYDLDPAWNKSFPFGYEDKENGFRGHVFLSSDNSTVVLSIKGTTLNGPTSKKDKFNDNLLFSCCCAKVGLSFTIRPVCKCYSSGNRCDNTCLSNALITDSLFYSIGVKLILDLAKAYPQANIWLVGHSLGGSLASLLGSTFGLPAVAFEAPGERLAAYRLDLPLPPAPDTGMTTSLEGPKALAYRPVPITHVYHTADPIPQGACTGFTSPCAQGGFALETGCHLGKSIIFDTVGKLGWWGDVRTHIIKHVITRVLEDETVDWGEDDNDGENDGQAPLEERKREVPVPVIEEECSDCHKWEFGDFPRDDKKRFQGLLDLLL